MIPSVLIVKKAGLSHRLQPAGLVLVDFTRKNRASGFPRVFKKSARTCLGRSTKTGCLFFQNGLPFLEEIEIRDWCLRF